MSALARLYLLYAILGVVLGFVLSRIGFTNYDELHRMFLFADMRMLLSFAGAAVFAMAVFHVFNPYKLIPVKHFHRGTVAGTVLFGIGWALSGSCPGIAWIQLGEGQLGAIITLIGLLAGALTYKALRPRLFRWDNGACE